MTEKGICKFCKLEKELIQAHIVPKKFYLDYELDNGYKAIDANGKWELCNNGFKDYILCHECDGGLFKKLDDYGYKILLHEYSKHVEKNEQDLIIYHFTDKDFDYNLLKKFFISILWRASVSKKVKGFLNVNLGKYEKIAKDILADKVLKPELFKFFIFKFPDKKELNKTVYINELKPYNSILYNIVMAGFDITVIVKNRMQYSTRKFYNQFIATEKNLYIFETESLYKNHEQKILKFAKNWEK